MACAALCDPRAPGFNPTLPVIVVDVHLEGADLTLLAADERLERKHFLHLPNPATRPVAQAPHPASMGNRFLRHTAFDILEDGRVEQTFFLPVQTKEFPAERRRRAPLTSSTPPRATTRCSRRTTSSSPNRRASPTTIAQGLHSFV